MHYPPEYQLWVINARRGHELADAARARLVPPVPRHSLRRAVGISIVRIGERLAGEPSPRLTREGT